MDATQSAVLIAHGFTGSPYELQGLADYLREKNMAVSLPTLPGHGTSPDDLRRHGPDSWMAALRASYAALENEYQQISIVGLSVGGSLALKLASEVPSASLVVIDAPVRLNFHTAIKVALPIWRALTGPDLIKPKTGMFANEQIPGYEQRCYDQIPIAIFQDMMRFLEREMNPPTFAHITAPTLLVQGSEDNIVSPSSAATVFKYLGSAKKERVDWQDRFHLIVQGERKQELYQLVADWIA